MKKDILFFITSLNIGGAERVLVDTLNEISNNSNNNYTVLTIYKEGSLEKELNKNIKVINLFNISKPTNLTMKFVGLLLKSVLFRKYIFKKKVNLNNYTKLIAYLEGTPTDVLSCFKNTKIAFIHTDIEKHLKNKNRKKVLTSYLTYEKIVCVSNAAKESFLKYIDSEKNKKFEELKNKTVVIHNYIDLKRIESLSKENIVENKNNKEINKENNKEINFKNYFLCVARLREEKGVLRLYNIFKNRKEDLVFIGDGPLYEKLNEMRIRDEKNNIHFLGEKINPYPYIKNARALIIPSYYEGYAMIAKEGEALNKFIISTKTNVKEALIDYDFKIIDDNINKSLDYFLENEDEILEKINKKKNEDKNYKIENTNIKIQNENNLKKLLEILEE